MNLFPVALCLWVTAAPCALAGTITTVAGTGVAGYNGDGILATNAQINTPHGVACDSAGNLYITDTFNCRIRRVDRVTRLITTFVGTGACGYNGDGIAANTAQIAGWTMGLNFDGFDNLFIPDCDNDRIRRVDAATLKISTVAGGVGRGYNGENVPALSAKLGAVYEVAVDPTGNVYYSNMYTNNLRKVDSSTGNVTTVAGSVTWTGGYNGDGIPATTAQLWWPLGIEIDKSGNPYVVDHNNDRVRRVDRISGLISTVAGTGVPGFNGDDLPATSAEVNGPEGLAMDASGNMFIADLANVRIRKVDPSTGIITTVAGNGTSGSGGDGYEATLAQFTGPAGVCVDKSGNVYVADNVGHRVRRIHPATLIVHKELETKGAVCTGSVVTYKMSWSNAGWGTAYDLTVTDTLPNGTRYRSPGFEYFGQTDGKGVPAVVSAYAATLAGPWTTGQPPDGTGPPLILRWEVERIAAGRSGYIRYRAEVSATLAGGSIVRNQAFATIYDDPRVYYTEALGTTVWEPARLVARAAVPSSVVVGKTFQVAVTVTNTGGLSATGVTATVFAGPGGGFASRPLGPVPTSVSALPAGASTTFVFSYTATGAGPVTFTITLAGASACGGVTVSATTMTTVKTPAVLAAVIDVIPAASCLGASFLVTLTVTNTGTSDMTGVSPAALRASGTGGVAPGGGPFPAPPLPLAGGGTMTFTWTYTAVSLGNVVFMTTVTGTDAVSGQPVSSGLVVSEVSSVVSPGALNASASVLPSTVSTGQWFPVTLTVTNTGGSPVYGIIPAAQVGPGSGLVALEGGPTPAGPVALAAGGVQTFTWTYSASGSGLAVFSATATGSTCNGAASVAGSATASATVQKAALLRAGLVTYGGVVCTGRGFLVTLTVTNAGEATATALNARPFLVSGGGSVAWLAGPMPAMPTTLAGGAAKSFTWTYTGTVAGAVMLTTTVTGVDGNSGVTVTTGPVSSGSAVVTTAGALKALAAAPAQVAVGQWFTVGLTVTNTGGGAVDGIGAVAGMGPGQAVLKGGPVPAGPIILGAGASQTFVWTYSASGSGVLGITVTVTGMACGDTSVGATGYAAIQVMAPAALAVDSLELSPAAVTLASPVTAKLVVRNAGGVTLRVIGINPVIGVGTTGGLGVPGPCTPSLPFLVAGGSAQVVTWMHGTGAPCGTAYVSVMPVGVEVATGQGLVAGPVASNVIGLAGLPAVLVLTPAARSAEGGGQVAVEALVQDACGIGVPGATVSFTILRGGGSLSVPSGVTDAAGRTSVGLTLGLEPGTNVVQGLERSVWISATAEVESLPNALALTSPGGALSSNVFSPGAGETVLVRVSPRTSEPVVVKVFSPSGRQVRTLRNQHFQSIGGGQLLVTWDGMTDDEFPVTRGVYLIRITGGGLGTVVLKVVVR